MSTYFDQFSILYYFKRSLLNAQTHVLVYMNAWYPFLCRIIVIPAYLSCFGRKPFLLYANNKDTDQPVHSCRQKCYTVTIQPNRLLGNLCNSALMFECYFVANREYKVSCDVTHFVQASSCDDKQHGQRLHILLQMVAELFSCDLIQARMMSID